ncbi:unnamed protein product [Peniophora sp. CBMAI 1063]|nr:unnamed protein product [Peniophora sp. CBMAI 1063]
MALTSSAEHHVYDANPLHDLADGNLTDTVCFVSFSCDGGFLAVGCQDGQLIVLDVDKWTPIRRRRLELHDFPTACVWDRHNVLFVGTQSGDVHQLVFGSSPLTDSNTFWPIGDPILALACTPTTKNCERLAFSSGDDVYVQDFKRYRSGEIARDNERKLPQPTAFPGLEKEDNGLLVRPGAVALEYVPGTRQLIGTYKHHGIAIWDEVGRLVHRILPHSVCIGRSALSPSGNYLYATNFCDGIDVYNLDKRRWAKSGFERTIKTDIGTNKLVPIVSIHDDTTVLVGTTVGKIEALNLSGDMPNVGFSRAAPASASELRFLSQWKYNHAEVFTEVVQAIV